MLTLLGANLILHVSGIRVKVLCMLGSHHANITKDTSNHMCYLNNVL
jgi:hypothetical protein